MDQGLARRWSPQQIAARLRSDFPEQPHMRVSLLALAAAATLLLLGSSRSVSGRVDMAKGLRSLTRT
ncbi:hypothetical protein D7V97_00035 [Corallococcus sp. CA053C]|nr:hypothetical protein D7V97_00035 [Corallococcus sp. CA053C]